jgi:hypothetical protein
LRNRLFPSLLSCLFVLPTSFMWIPKTHNRTSLQVWLANVLHFCSFCKPTFSGATREWDALCVYIYIYIYVCVWFYFWNLE